MKMKLYELNEIIFLELRNSFTAIINNELMDKGTHDSIHPIKFQLN